MSLHRLGAVSRMLVCCLLPFAPRVLHAQQPRPEVLRGRVVADSGGIPITGADVVVTMPPDRAEVATKTDSTGNFLLRVPRGTGDYLVHVDHGIGIFRGLEQYPELLTDPRSLRKSYLEQVNLFLDGLKRGCRDLNIDYVPLRTDTPLHVVYLVPVRIDLIDQD